MYALTKNDLPAAAALCADAFKDDPVWRRVFDGIDRFDTRFNAFFRMPLRHGLRYGAVWAPSEKLEGMAAWVPGAYAEMTFPRIVMAGSFMIALKLGSAVANRLRPVFDRRPAIQERYMHGKPHRYLMVLGVRTALQGRGYARQLLDALIAECDATGEYIYLETETEDNVRMYEHFGFSVNEKIELPGLGLPMWSMARAPESIAASAGVERSGHPGHGYARQE